MALPRVVVFLRGDSLQRGFVSCWMNVFRQLPAPFDRQTHESVAYHVTDAGDVWCHVDATAKRLHAPFGACSDVISRVNGSTRVLLSIVFAWHPWHFCGLADAMRDFDLMFPEDVDLFSSTSAPRSTTTVQPPFAATSGAVRGWPALYHPDLNFTPMAFLLAAHYGVYDTDVDINAKRRAVEHVAIQTSNHVGFKVPRALGPMRTVLRQFRIENDPAHSMGIEYLLLDTEYNGIIRRLERGLPMNNNGTVSGVLHPPHLLLLHSAAASNESFVNLTGIQFCRTSVDSATTALLPCNVAVPALLEPGMPRTLMVHPRELLDQDNDEDLDLWANAPGMHHQARVAEGTR